MNYPFLGRGLVRLDFGLLTMRRSGDTESTPLRSCRVRFFGAAPYKPRKWVRACHNGDNTKTTRTYAARLPP